MSERFEVVGIGNALVDVLARIEPGFLDAQSLTKGIMTLVDADTSDRIYAAMPPAVEKSGGSCGNTMAGFAALGGKGAYIGKIRNDQLGRIFRHDMAALGVAAPVAMADDGPSTGRCLVLVTPDADRTMLTYLGAATELGPEDVDAAVIQAADCVYMEGYLFDKERAKQAFIKAADIAHAAGGQVSLTLSDPFCVGRHRDAFRALVENHVDILFANEEEILSLYETRDFDAAMQAVRAHCEIACLTRSEKGSVIVSGEAFHVIDAVPVAKVVDTTGAGDQYAAGFLYGWAKGLDLATSGRIASMMAGEVISHVGPRTESDVKAAMQKIVG